MRHVRRGGRWTTVGKTVGQPLEPLVCLLVSAVSSTVHHPRTEASPGKPGYPTVQLVDKIQRHHSSVDEVAQRLQPQRNRCSGAFLGRIKVAIGRGRESH